MDQNIQFYNEIAEEYDAILDQDKINSLVRRKMEAYFLAAVKSGWVLDFGGGTGRDLEWLINNRFGVIFCEPSPGMRSKAIHQYKPAASFSVLFLDNARADFTGWARQLPFSLKVNAVLSNFAVINSIENIRMLFEHLSLVMHPGGQIIALVLQNKKENKSENKRSGGLYNGLRSQLRALLFPKPVTLQVRYNEVKQTVYMHSRKDLIKSSADWFDFVAFESLSGTTFSILHLIRK